MQEISGGNSSVLHSEEVLCGITSGKSQKQSAMRAAVAYLNSFTTRIDESFEKVNSGDKERKARRTCWA